MVKQTCDSLLSELSTSPQQIWKIGKVTVDQRTYEDIFGFGLVPQGVGLE